MAAIATFARLLDKDHLRAMDGPVVWSCSPASCSLVPQCSRLTQFNAPRDAGGGEATHSSDLPQVLANIGGIWGRRPGGQGADVQGCDIRRSIETRLQTPGFLDRRVGPHAPVLGCQRLRAGARAWKNRRGHATWPECFCRLKPTIGAPSREGARECLATGSSRSTTIASAAAARRERGASSTTASR